MSDTIQLYVERVERLIQQRRQTVTEEDLQEIARELGMSDADLAAVEEEVQSRYERGMGFVDHGMWNDAVEQLREAAALAPSRVYLLHALANAYFCRGRDNKSKDDMQQAEAWARRCLDLDPQYQAAFILLGEIKDQNIAESEGLSTRKAAMTLVGSLVLCVVGGSVASIIAVIIEPSLAEDQNTTTETDSVVVNDNLVVPVAATQPKDTKPVPLQPSAGNLPVDFNPGRWKGQVALDLREVNNKVYTDKAYFSWKGLIENTGNLEIDEVTAKLELINGSDEVLVSDIITLVDDYKPALRPGDVNTFYTTKGSEAAVERAKVTITNVKAEPAAKGYAKSKLISPKWAVKKPANLNIEVRERFTSHSHNDMMNSGFFKAAWEIKNTGSTPIRTVKVGLRLMDGNGTTLDDSSWLVAFSSSPTIRPGEMRLASTTKSVAKTYKKYELSIVEIN